MMLSATDTTQLLENATPYLFVNRYWPLVGNINEAFAEIHQDMPYLSDDILMRRITAAQTIIETGKTRKALDEILDDYFIDDILRDHALDLYAQLEEDGLLEPVDIQEDVDVLLTSMLDSEDDWDPFDDEAEYTFVGYDMDGASDVSDDMDETANSLDDSNNWFDMEPVDIDEDEDDFCIAGDITSVLRKYESCTSMQIADELGTLLPYVRITLSDMVDAGQVNCNDSRYSLSWAYELGDNYIYNLYKNAPATRRYFTDFE